MIAYDALTLVIAVVGFTWALILWTRPRKRGRRSE